MLRLAAELSSKHGDRQEDKLDGRKGEPYVEEALEEGHRACPTLRGRTSRGPPGGFGSHNVCPPGQVVVK